MIASQVAFSLTQKRKKASHVRRIERFRLRALTVVAAARARPSPIPRILANAKGPAEAAGPLRAIVGVRRQPAALTFFIRRLLRRAAWFLWMTPLAAALSRRLTARRSASSPSSVPIGA